MKKLSITIILLCIIIYTNAQNAIIKGSVKNEEDGKSMQNVSVTLKGGPNIQTNKEGNFQFANLNIGKYQLTYSFLGYDTVKDSIEISKINQVVELPAVLMKLNAIQINEVVISGSQSNVSPKYDGSNFIITSKDLKLTNPIGTEEVLKKVPGVNVSGDMGISNRLNVGIRGSYPRRSANILIMEDGTPIAPAPYLAPEAYYNPPSDRLDGIEILKGADILAYGSNTMYGAINYITKKPSTKPTFGLNLTAGNNGYHSEYITYGGTWDKVGAEIQVLNKQFGGFQNNSQSSIFNTTAKLYTELNQRSALYVKLNYHQEKSKASYSALTPLSYKLDPIQNPFDADDLTTRRYAVDLIYNYKLRKNIILSSKVYASQFQRDWWRQENVVIKASAAKTYLGDNIFNSRYSYLDNKSFEADDYVRVGKVTNGRESTRARNRLFTVVGAQQSIRYNLETTTVKMNFEAMVKGHWETFGNTEIKNDSSRFSRSGTIEKDQFYNLAAYSFYIKDKIIYERFTITPTIRYEYVKMYGFDNLAISKMTNNDGSKYFGSQKNTYSGFVPGVSFGYDLMRNMSNKLNLYGGIYRGYTAPVADYAFLNVEDGVVSTPSADKPVNRKPETSLNFEAGVRGDLFRQITNAQVVYFNNHVKNYYSAGRNEAFQTLGAVNIHGIEAAININLHKIFHSKQYQLTLNLAGTYMNGKVLSGLMMDADILKAKHNDDTKNEVINKINTERTGYEVYFTSSSGQDSLVTRELSNSDFNKIKRLDYIFGESGISNNTVPYLPPYILNFGANYTLKGFSMGLNFNYVAQQYTDYLNLVNETSEGAIGRLNAFTTIDCNLNYSFDKHRNKQLNGLSIFIAGKNLTNKIYQASRLHRVSSGIMPGGFRQINAGIKLVF